MNVTFANVKVNISILSMMVFGPSASHVMTMNMANAIHQNIVLTRAVSVKKND